MYLYFDYFMPKTNLVYIYTYKNEIVTILILFIFKLSNINLV